MTCFLSLFLFLLLSAPHVIYGILVNHHNHHIEIPLSHNRPPLPSHLIYAQSKRSNEILIFKMAPIFLTPFYISSNLSTSSPTLSLPSFLQLHRQWMVTAMNPQTSEFRLAHDTILSPSPPPPSSSSSLCFLMKKNHKISNFITWVSVLMTQETQRQGFGPTLSTSTGRPFSSSSSSFSSRPIYMILKLMVFFIIPVVLSCFVATADSSCNEIDKDSLLAFFGNLTISFPYGPLNWSESVDCCFWEGILCAENTGNGDQRVIHVLLPSRGLSGSISASLSKLTGLLQLNISHNRFSGNLPIQFFSLLNHLQILDLSYNQLTGELPNVVANNNSSTSVINEVDLSSNLFSGMIPDSFLQKLGIAAAGGSLTYFNVSNNSFTGQIPISWFCTKGNNSSSLRYLDFSSNKYSDQIPYGIGACSKLETFRAGFNSLTGPLPSDIYHAISLTEISLPLNKISGNISDGINRLTNLTTLALYSNQLGGQIPQTFGELSKLENLLLHINNLTGTLPPSLMNCVNLVTLNLRVNFLEGNLSDFNFSGLVNLTTLDLGNNNFTGNLPPTLFSCKSLAAVRFASNQLEGQISPDILGLQSLSFLSISTNKLRNFTGAMRILNGLKNLTTLALSKNFNEELMPEDENLIGPDDFQTLQVLGLGGCNFTGSIPRWLANFQSLEVVDLSYNRFTGSIPAWLSTLPQLFYVDLSYNFITGIFPPELASLPALTSQQANNKIERSYLELPVFIVPSNASQQQYNQLSNLPPAIYLGHNNLSGSIPIQIAQLQAIHQLDLSHNDFSGTIPAQISNLTNLEKLDLSGNNLSGEIPVSLKSLHFLSFFSVAYNDLEGEIPTGGQFDTFPPSSFEGNPRLCGLAVNRTCPSEEVDIATRRRVNKKIVVGLGLAVCFGAIVISSLLTLWLLSRRRINPGGHHDKIELESISANTNNGVHPEVGKDASVVVLFPNKTNEIKDLTVSEILRATENFSQANIIGCGGFGLVYKARLPDGTKLAIKKLSGDSCLMEREFKAEVEALSTAQHENLVALRGYCVHDGSRLLIYTYMENGSLDSWLHEKDDGPSQLDWPTRRKIAQDASCGLDYMHQICEPHIVHRDIKSSNILLDENFKAHVADFGLSRLILPYHTHVTTELVGTLGYIPPEYGQAWIATLRGDVYSFGVLMLELLTGRRPVEVCKPKMSTELVGWVQQMRSEGKQDQVFDPHLRGKGFEEEMLQVLDVACMCVNQNPFKRPSIREVVDWLKNVGTANQQQNKD